MTKKLLLAIASVAVLAGAGSAQAYMIDDYTLQTYSNNTSESTSSSWYQRVGGSDFEAFGIDWERGSNTFTLHLYTNFSKNEDDFYRSADIAINFGNGYDYAIVLNPHGSGALGDWNSYGINSVGLYESVAWQTSADIFGSRGYGHSGSYRDCAVYANSSSSNTCGSGYNGSGEEINTLIYDGDLVDGVSTTVNQVTLYSGSPSSSNPKYRIDVTLSGTSVANLFDQGFELLWGNATCGNDTIHGFVPGGGQQVPEPATLSVLGLGLLGMGLARRRRKAA